MKKINEKQVCEDIIAIHTQGLNEEIRCTMCTNPMRSDRGCDGGCMYDEDMYEKVMDVIRNRIVSSVTPTHKKTPTRKKGHWIMNSDFPDEIICSCCNTNYDMWFWEQGTMNYCPHCGAEMQEVEHE